jgi:hypothetical protein
VPRHAAPRRVISPWRWGPAGTITYFFGTIAAVITLDETTTMPNWAHQLCTAGIYIVPMGAVIAWNVSVIRRRRGKGQGTAS